MEDNKNLISDKFENCYGQPPELFVHSTGRINLIGEHTDYHDGFVMPAAIDLGINWALKKNDDGVVRGLSLDTNESDEFEVESKKRVETQWMQYLQGVVEILKDDGYNVGGVDLIIKSDLPIGGGLSSSSSLATGFTFALSKLFNLKLSKKDLTEIGCRAEWWYGTRGGNMDHFAISHGKKDKATFFDIHNFEFEYVPIPKNLAIVVFETTVRHNQKKSPYKKRREEAEKGLELLKKYYPEKKIEKLRDVDFEMLNKAKNSMDDLTFRRCLHVIGENQRVIDAKEALKNSDFKTFKENVQNSHRSLRDDYQVSCPELDIAVAEAEKIDGFVAGRMTGGGFGGCTVNLIEKDKAAKFADELCKSYKKITGLTPKVYICRADDGVRIME